MSTAAAASPPGNTDSKEDAQEEALKQMRARRADEWERVRNPDVPTEREKCKYCFYISAVCAIYRQCVTTLSLFVQFHRVYCVNSAHMLVISLYT